MSSVYVVEFGGDDSKVEDVDGELLKLILLGVLLLLLLIGIVSLREGCEFEFDEWIFKEPE